VLVQVDGDPAPLRFDHVVVAAGLQADRVSALVDGERSPAILPFRGEYLGVDAAKQDLVRGMVYPVPDPRYPFLGVHFTRRVDGSLEVGPNAVLATRREGYRRRDVSASDLRDVVAWPGFWRLAREHWRTGVDEVVGSASKRAFMRSASRYVPDIGVADVTRAGSGVRAQAVDRDGSLVDDFRITRADGVTCVRNAPSPGATSSLAIAEHVVSRVLA
jgi:L-2-hydroxyglutarate oxidase